MANGREPRDRKVDKLNGIAPNRAHRPLKTDRDRSRIRYRRVREKRLQRKDSSIAKPVQLRVTAGNGSVRFNRDARVTRPTGTLDRRRPTPLNRITESR